MRARLQAWVGADRPLGWLALVAVVALTLAAQTRQYAAVWRSERTLWAHAVGRAPEKPRVLNNYGVALVAAGAFAEARTWFRRAAVAGRSPHLPPWDRVEGWQAGAENLRAVEELLAWQARRPR